jgi:hypothetical protein
MDSWLANLQIQAQRPYNFQGLAQLAGCTPKKLRNSLCDLCASAFRFLSAKRHFRRYANPEATAAKYGIGIRELKARARREAWA